MSEFETDRQQFYANVQQQIENEEYYPKDSIAQEDYMQSGIDDLYDKGVITESEAVSIFGSWIRARRPDVTVINIPRQIARPFYE